MSEERNERALFEGGKSYSRTGGDRRRGARRKADVFMGLLKYFSVALLAALLVKYLG